jgi:hypothetical protein
LDQFRGLKEGLNSRLPLKHRKRGQYARPTYTRTILGFIACAATYFEQGGYDDDAKAFKDFCFDVFDSDRAESAFGRRYEVDADCTRKQAYEGAVRLLKYAGVRLRYQQVKYGEDNWDLFMEQIKEMKAREQERNEGFEETLDDMDDALTRIRNGDETTIQAVLQLAKEFEEDGIMEEDEYM